MSAICSAIGCSNVKPCGDHATRTLPSNWQAITRLVLDRDGHACRNCGKPCPHPRHHDVDHLVPREVGGSDNEVNLRTVCSSANRGTGVCA